MTIPARQPQRTIDGNAVYARLIAINEESGDLSVVDKELQILIKDIHDGKYDATHTSPPAPAPEEPEITNKMFDFAIDRVYKKGMKDGAKAGRERVLDEVLNAFLERPDDQFIQYIESLQGAQEEQG